MTTPSRELRWLSDTVRQMYAAETMAELGAALIGPLHDRFRLTAVGLEELGCDGSSYLLHAVRMETPPPPGYEACIHDHPALKAMLGPLRPQTVHLAALTSAVAWRRTDHYHGLARPMGWCDQFILIARGGATLGNCDVMRDRPFRSAEREFLRLLQPHFESAWIRVQPVRAAAADPSPAEVTLDASLRPHGIPPKVAALLETYFAAAGHGGGLPSRLGEWVRTVATGLEHGVALDPLRALAVEAPQGRLLVRYFPQPAGGKLRLLEMPAPLDPISLRRRGLTSRECEVLHWIGEGKRDAEIAIILGCAPATVSKHVERILAKLGVESRVAAVSEASRGLGLDGHSSRDARGLT
jgi:DNA-binding CsgD family transcriptional regulator